VKAKYENNLFCKYILFYPGRLCNTLTPPEDYICKGLHQQFHFAELLIRIPMAVIVIVTLNMIESPLVQSDRVGFVTDPPPAIFS
jgi:hypothetical protein